MLLTPTQKIVARSTARFRVICSGRRWGKTTLSVEEIKGLAVSKESRIAYIAPTYQQARDIAWEILIKELKPIAVKINESRLEIVVRTLDGKQSWIALRGWESIESLRGQHFDLLVLDEVAMMRNFWSIWQEVLTPTLTDTKGQAIFISTPRGFNHFYDLYRLEHDKKRGQGFQSFHFTSFDNPHIPKEELENARKQITEDRFCQEYLADFRKTEGLVYKEFNRLYHTYKELPPITVVEKILGIDFGYTNPTCILTVLKDYKGNYWIEDEWYKTGRTSAQIAEVAKQMKPNVVYADPEAPEKIKDLELAGLYCREVIKGKDSISSGIDQVRELFKQGRLNINQNCLNLIFELETYHYPDKKSEHNEAENPVAENNHACLVGDTMITMANGLKKLKNVKINDIVKTPQGNQKVIDHKLTRKQAEIIEIELSNGYKIKGTSDHKIKTQRGYVAIDTLRYDDIIKVLNTNKIPLWKSQLSLMEKNIIGTVNTIVNQLMANPQDCTVKSGSIITAKSRKVATYTTKTEIQPTMKSLILNLLKAKSIYQNIIKEIGRNQSLEKRLKSISKILDHLQNNGTLQTTGINGTKNTELMVGLTDKQLLKIVKSAAKSIKLIFQPEVDFAISIVAKKHCIKENVYNLTVENEHCYYANKILVKNCDAMRYVVMTNDNSVGYNQTYIPHTYDDIFAAI